MDEFIKQFNLTSVDFDGWYGTQCVDLALAWEHWNNWPLIHGNAKDQPNNISDFYEFIPYSAGLIPQEGWLAIWGMLPYGHIAVTQKNCTATTLITFDQNWPTDLRCRIVNHTYKNVIGFIKPKKEVIMEKGQYYQTADGYNYYLIDGRVIWIEDTFFVNLDNIIKVNKWQDIPGKLMTYQSDVDTLQAKYDKLDEVLDETTAAKSAYESQVKQLTEEVDNKEKQLTIAEDKLTTCQSQLTTVNQEDLQVLSWWHKIVNFFKRIVN